MLAGDAPKAFSAQLVALTLIALKLGKERETLSPEELSANLGATARRSGSRDCGWRRGVLAS